MEPFFRPSAVSRLPQVSPHTNFRHHILLTHGVVDIFVVPSPPTRGGDDFLEVPSPLSGDEGDFFEVPSPLAAGASCSCPSPAISLRQIPYRKKSHPAGKIPLRQNPPCRRNLPTPPAKSPAGKIPLPPGGYSPSSPSRTF